MIHAELTKKINSGEGRRRSMRCLEEFLFLLASCSSDEESTTTKRLTLSDMKTKRKDENGVSDPFVSAVMSIALHALMDEDDEDDEIEYVGVGIVESLIFGMSWSALRKALSSFVVTLVQCGDNDKNTAKHGFVQLEFFTILLWNVRMNLRIVFRSFPTLPQI